MLSEDSQHRTWAEGAISDCLDRHEYAPIIFVGSGISRRYLGAPSWRELLSELSTICPEIEYPIEYYEEEYTNPQIATQFINAFRDWAWEDHGQFDHFPEELYDRDGSPDKYLKYKVAEFFRKLSPDSPDDLPDNFQEEIEALRQISPHAVVTTNYDQLLENIYPGFETMVGQDIYNKDHKKVGDLFKIHGCVTREDSLILTESDYDDFEKQKKYISAKLLTYFSEHPVLILGHSASDDNIQRLLSELDRMIPTDETDLISNIFLLNYESDAETLEGDPNLSRDELIDVGDERRVRVNAVHAHSFKWVYDAFGQGEALDKVQVEQIRKFSNKIYDVTTKDAPRKKVNFERLEYFSDEDNIEQLLGFVPIDNPETVEGLRQAGIPIGEGEVSTEAVEDINARLNTATQNYNSNGTLITDRATILEFRKRISDLDLTQDKCELLIWSSLNQRLQGADWIIEYGEGVLYVIRSMIEDPGVKAHTIQRLEMTLLAMGESELLEELYERHSDNGLLRGNLSAVCDRSVEDRLGVYGSGNNILFTDSEENMIDLYEQTDDSRLLELLNLCGDMLIDESQSHGKGNPSNATDFRKLELVLIARELS